MTKRFEHQVCQSLHGWVVLVNDTWQGMDPAGPDPRPEDLAGCPSEWEYLHHAGMSGWELVSVLEEPRSEADRPPMRTLYLKRESSAESERPAHQRTVSTPVTKLSEMTIAPLLVFRHDQLAFLGAADFGAAAFGDLEVPEFKDEFDGTQLFHQAVQEADIRERLHGAPVASWLLARLAYLADSIHALYGLVEEDGEDGGFSVGLLVTERRRPAGRLSLRGNVAEVSLGVNAVDRSTTERIVAGFLAAVTGEPDAVERFHITIPAAGHDTMNEYGWNHGQFLGAWNETPTAEPGVR